MGNWREGKGGSHVFITCCREELSLISYTRGHGEVFPLKNVLLSVTVVYKADHIDGESYFSPVSRTSSGTSGCVTK